MVFWLHATNTVMFKSKNEVVQWILEDMLS